MYGDLIGANVCEYDVFVNYKIEIVWKWGRDLKDKITEKNNIEDTDRNIEKNIIKDKAIEKNNVEGFLKRFYYKFFPSL